VPKLFVVVLNISVFNAKIICICIVNSYNMMHLLVVVDEYFETCL
jgi:hypothetical protein